MTAISRREFLNRTATGIAAVTSSPTILRSKPVQDKPNIIYILCDDLGYGDLACYDHPEIQTPHLDQLATDGMKFTDCYAAAPVCSPARAGFLTGRTPNRCCIFDHLGSKQWPHNEQRFMSGDEITVAELLKDVGYATCLVGKWHLTQGFNDGILNANPATTQPMPDDQGFDYYMATENNADDDHCNVKNFIRNGIAIGQSIECSSDAIVTECIDWLENKRDKQKPFFLFVSFHSPHEPVATPSEYTNMYTTGDDAKNRYYGNITHMDAAVGNLLDYLDNTAQLTDSTFVMFTSDNGPEPDYHWWSQHPYGLVGPHTCAKLSLYEGGIRVPGIIRWPDTVAPGSESSEPISGIDMLPTLCEIGGAEVPTDRAIDGSSFVPALTGAVVTRHQPLFWQYNYAETCNVHTDDSGDNKPMIVIRDGDWKLCTNLDYNHVKLYNLSQDSYEVVNLADQEIQRVTEMKAVLESIAESVKAESENCAPIIGIHRSFRQKEIVRIGQNRLEIFDLSGKKVAELNSYKNKFNLRLLNLPRGTYTIKVNNRFHFFVKHDGYLNLHI